MANHALQHFRRPPERLNRAQSVLYAYQKVSGHSAIPLSDMKPFGGGRAPDGLCGAIYATLTAASLAAQDTQHPAPAAAGKGVSVSSEPPPIRQSSQPTLTWLTDFQKAKAQAKAEKKSILLFFHGSDWCPPCAQTQRQVIDSPEFTRFARQSLILVDVDLPEKSKPSEELRRANLALKAKFNSRGFIICPAGLGRGRKRASLWRNNGPMLLDPSRVES
jgi:thiol-disulfide isomerase/thioredoxin